MQIISLSKKMMSAWAILGISLLATIFSSLQVKKLAFTSDQVALKIQARHGAYALTLCGGVALFAASIGVDRQEWHTYVETLRADWHTA